MSKLLLDEQPLMILPQLAIKIGLNEAIILQQVHYWLLQKQHLRDGQYWVYNTYEGWQENFPFWSVATIKRALTALRNPYIPKAGDQRVARPPLLVATPKYNARRYDKTLWYTIDYEALNSIENPQVKMTQGSKCPDGSGQNDPMDQVKMTRPIPETTTKTTPETTLTPSAENSKPDMFDLALITEKAQEREGSWTIPPEAGGADPWADGPVDAFAEVLAGIIPIMLPPKERASWARKLALIAAKWSTEENPITPAIMAVAIRAVPDSDIGWKTYKSPYAGNFDTDIGPLLLNGGKLPKKRRANVMDEATQMTLRRLGYGNR